MPMVDSDLHAILDRILGGAKPASLETEGLDFKRPPEGTAETIRLVCEASICFANSAGGTVVVGVANHVGGPDAFVGCDLEPHVVQRRVYQLTEPPLMIGARTIEHGGVRLLVVDVFRSFEIHADKQGRATHRIGTDCVPMTPNEHRRLREERLGVDWSAQPSDRLPSEVSQRAMHAAREALGRIEDDRRPLALLSDDDLLRTLGLLVDGYLLRSGEILFCEPEPQDPPAILYQYRRTPGGEATAVERLTTPLILAFERTMELVRARRNVTPLTLPNGQQFDIADFPEIAVREALSNAVLHRDYRLPQPVNLEHSPHTFVVISPGPLVGSVSRENIITHASTPRNPVLARAARLLRLAEETGRGVDRMFREMIRSGQDLPVIEEGPDYVRVVLSGGAPRTAVARFVAQLPPAERDDTDAMLVLFTLCHRRSVTAENLAPVLQKSEDETELVLRRLSQDQPGIIEATRQSARHRRRQYRLRAESLRGLGTAVRYHQRGLDEIDRKVIAHLNEYGRVSNRTLQNIFDIDVFKARDLLADLQQREIIVRTSEAARGPNVEYGPGPKFPRSRRRRGN